MSLLTKISILTTSISQAPQTLVVLAVVAAAGRALRPALAPLLDAGEVAAVPAALAPHEQPAHHGVAHGAARGRHAAPVAPPRRGRGRALEAAAAARAARVDRGGLLVLGVNCRQPALGQDLKSNIHF